MYELTTHGIPVLASRFIYVYDVFDVLTQHELWNKAKVPNLVSFLRPNLVWGY